MIELTDVADENKQQWKSINTLAAEVKSLSGAVDAQGNFRRVPESRRAG